MSDSELRDEFWKLPLSRLNDKEWEALCDHCGRCCLKKLQDEDTEEIYWTRVICRFHDEENSRCGCYGERTKKVPDCLDVKKMSLHQIQWMPPTCAYRLRMENKPLLSWHPLLSGSSTPMEEEGISVSGKTLSEEHVHELGYHEHVIKWV
ncbi:MAG: YcgN family cysteine cluster protein [Gammaproteobacteria bacterium]